MYDGDSGATSYFASASPGSLYPPSLQSGSVSCINRTVGPSIAAVSCAITCFFFTLLVVFPSQSPSNHPFDHPAAVVTSFLWSLVPLTHLGYVKSMQARPAACCWHSLLHPCGNSNRQYPYGVYAQPLHYLSPIRPPFLYMVLNLHTLLTFSSNIPTIARLCDLYNYIIAQFDRLIK